MFTKVITVQLRLAGLTIRLAPLRMVSEEETAQLGLRCDQVRCLSWVKTGKAQCEHMFYCAIESAFVPIGDTAYSI